MCLYVRGAGKWGREGREGAMSAGVWSVVAVAAQITDRKAPATQVAGDALHV